MNNAVMNSNVILPKKKFYILLIACSIIILMASLDVMFRVKDVSLFEKWLKATNSVGDPSDLLGIYVTANLSIFFTKIIVPAFFALYTYYAYVKIRINYLYVFIWTVLILGSIAFTVVEMQLYSVFFYIQLASYGIMVVTLLSLVDIIGNKKSK